MIKINLLAAEKTRAAAAGKSKLPQFNLKGQQLTVGCALILVATAGLIGWRYQKLGTDGAQLDADIAAAQQETARLHTVIADVQKFELRRTQLQQRVTLIEELRKSQAGPVHMLDQLSLALPPMMWLTDLKQNPGGTDVIIEGKSTGLTTLSDFVANLEASGYFKKSVEIVSTSIDSGPNTGDLIKFTLKATFQRPAPPAAVPAATTAPVTPPPAKPGN